MGQLEYRGTFPRLAAGQVWIANCPTTMIESARGEFRGSIYRRSRMHPLLVPGMSYRYRGPTWEMVWRAKSRDTQRI